MSDDEDELYRELFDAARKMRNREDRADKRAAKAKALKSTGKGGLADTAPPPVKEPAPEMSGRRHVYEGWSDADQELMHTVGLRIRVLRKEHDYSLQTLANAAGLNESYLGELERGRVNVSVLVLARVFAALGVTLSDVLLDQ